MSCEQGHKISQQRFMQIRVDFVKHVDDIRSFLDYAVPSGLLTKGHENRIMSERNPDDQTRQLHDYIYKKLPYDSDKLMSALKESKHFKIFDLLDEQSVYPMKFKTHGRVVLINNVKFDDEEKYPERLGSEKDVEGITKLFTAFNFDVQLYSNKTAEEMEDSILKEAAESTANEDCFVMFLMSHGALGNIVGVDGEKLPYSTINKILKKSTPLKNKPKLIYVNTCEINPTEKDIKKYFNVPDLYVTFATVPESLAFPTDESGSVFIKCLISVYETNKDRCDISSLSLDINSQVSKEGNEISMDQVSSSFSTLKKNVILRAKD
ncbi:caspase-7-like isoform X6 [Octopus sinensis]|uniref:Caspase-7-like isoform X6 n=1 Tax=Octopus sinensis TaxID=2607531 RepID=A0A6P7TR60_9MOLL|nr:caspase-7-like isoform X6 [Octopus sinensis]XP_036369440.1 caspase-7-like isoform X6 [Octopus sinensis]